MELSKRARDLISRATALCVGLALAFACFRIVGGIRASIAEADEMQRLTGYRPKATVPAILVLGAIGTGGAALVIIGFAIVPTSWLYRIDPRPSEVGPDDVVERSWRSLLP
jgi:hypothetical protein